MTPANTFAKYGLATLLYLLLNGCNMSTENWSSASEKEVNITKNDGRELGFGPPIKIDQRYLYIGSNRIVRKLRTPGKEYANWPISVLLSENQPPVEITIDKYGEGTIARTVARSDVFNETLYITLKLRKIKPDGQEGIRLYKTTNAGLSWKSVKLPDGLQGYSIALLFSDALRGFIIPDQGSFFFTTADGGETWSRLILVSDYARMESFGRHVWGQARFDLKKEYLYITSYDEKTQAARLWRYKNYPPHPQRWELLADLPKYSIKTLALQDNGDLLLLALNGVLVKSGDEERESELWRWDGHSLSFVKNFGSNTLFNPADNGLGTALYTGPNGFIMVDGDRFRNEKADLPIFDVSYVSKDNGKTWERQHEGIMSTFRVFDPATGLKLRFPMFGDAVKRNMYSWW